MNTSLRLQHFCLHHWPPLVLILFLTLSELGGSTLRGALGYDRAALQAGEIWRLLTAHLVHLGWRHYIMNTAGLLLVWILFYPGLDARRFWLTCAIAALSISLGLFILNPELESYVGFSGILHGLFVVGVLRGLASARLEHGLLFAAITAKLGWEQWHGALPGSAEWAGGKVIVDAHLYGALTGLLLGLLLLGINRPAGQN